MDNSPDKYGSQVDLPVLGDADCRLVRDMCRGSHSLSSTVQAYSHSVDRRRRESFDLLSSGGSVLYWDEENAARATFIMTTVGEARTYSTWAHRKMFYLS